METADGTSIAKGSLAERPFPRLLYFFHKQKLTGRVALVDPAGDKSIVFLREGFPVHVDRRDPQDRIDRVLVESGLATESVVAQAESKRRLSGLRLGMVLEQMGAITKAKLSEALKIQLNRKLNRLFFQPDASFEVFTDRNHPYGSGADFDVMKIEPRALIYEGIRSAYDDARLTRELAPLAGRRLQLAAMPSMGPLGNVGPPPGQAQTVQALQAGKLRCLENLPSLGGQLHDAKATILALLYVELLDSSSNTKAKGPLVARGVQFASLSSLPPRRAAASSPELHPPTGTPPRTRR